MVPDILSFPRGCKFNNRCPEVMDICRETEPELIEVAPGRQVRCHLCKAGKGCKA
jgi:oligopeptide/dipeptide ABC transporter ATP-binding protein